jgi:hypothetical protein
MSSMQWLRLGGHMRVGTGTQAKREAGNGQEKSVRWSQYFAENRNWLTKQIDALESMDQIRGEKRPTLDLTWVLSLYRLSRDYLDAFNESHTMTHEMKTLVEPSKRRVGLLEAGPSGAAKPRKTTIVRDALTNVSKPTREIAIRAHR